jgi:AcrR family transcriptional regulator
MATPLDTNSRTDDIVDGITRLVLAGGFERVTMRAIAEQVRISQGTLANHLTNRERLLRVCASRFADRRLRELDYQVRRVGAVGLMPMDDHDLRSVRVWLAWREAARHADGLGRAVADADLKEEWLLRRALASEAPTADDPTGRRFRESTIRLCLATLRGLREAVCARGEHALDVATARELWMAQLVAVDQLAPVDQLAAQPGVTASARARSSATIASGSSAE